MDTNQTSRQAAFCAHAINDPNDVLEVTNALEDERFATNPLVTGGPGIRFYAGAPLIMDGDKALGTVCVIDRKKKKLTDDQLNALKSLSNLVVDQLELRRRNQELKKVVDEREQARILLEKSNREIEDLNAKLMIRNKELEEEIIKFQDKHSILGSPAEKVIETLLDLKSKLTSPQDLRTLDSLVDIIGSHKLYTVDVINTINGSQDLDWDTKDFLLSQFQAKTVDPVQGDVPRLEKIEIADSENIKNIIHR